MTLLDIVLLAAMIMGAAALYSSIGHAGASGYIAAMALMGVAPAIMKPSALALNIMVAAFATLRWTRNGRDLAWKSILPLIAGSIPAAFAGGAIQLSASNYRLLLGLMLLAAALKFLLQPNAEPGEAPVTTSIPIMPGAAIGALIGLLSGLTGTGGGVFLSPLLLLFGWTGARQASGIVAPFILVNSAAALAGNVAALRFLPPELPAFVMAALTGAMIGTHIGIHFVSAQMLQRLLGAVLLVAAAKFLFT